MGNSSSIDPPVLHVTMSSGKELDLSIDTSSLQQKEFGECKLTELLGGPSQDEISITVRITYDEIGAWLTEQCRLLLKIPENTDISTEIDSTHDLCCYIRPSSGPVRQVFVNLYRAMSEDVYCLVRYVGGWGRLLDAGFEMLDSSCVNFNNAKQYIDFTLFGLVNKISVE